MSIPLTQSPDVTYATKPNIDYPGVPTQASAAEDRAEDRLGDAFPTLSITVDSGAVTAAEPAPPADEDEGSS